MRHLATRYVAERVGNSISRTIVEKVDDTKLMQYHYHSIFADEQQQNIEHVHPYGYTSVVQPPTGGNNGQQRLGAEAFVCYLGGGRSHGVAFVTGDRRFRLYKLAGGEVALHDDQGQQVHLRRDGIWGSVPNNKKIMLQIMNDTSMPSGQSSSGQPMGQVQQAGRPASINLQFDSSQFTLNHPNGAVNFNCASFAVNSSGDTVVNAGGNIKLISQVYALVSAAKAAIIYSVRDIYHKALISINVKSPENLVTPDWAGGAKDPPITS